MTFIELANITECNRSLLTARNKSGSMAASELTQVGLRALTGRSLKFSAIGNAGNLIAQIGIVRVDRTRCEGGLVIGSSRQPWVTVYVTRGPPAPQTPSTYVQACVCVWSLPMTVAQSPSPAPNLIELAVLNPHISVASLLAEAAATSPPPSRGKAADVEKLRGLIALVVRGRLYLKGQALVDLIERSRTDRGVYSPTERRAIQTIGREERQKASSALKTRDANKLSRSKSSPPPADTAPVVDMTADRVTPSVAHVKAHAIPLASDGRPVSCLQHAPGLLFKSGAEIRLFFNEQGRQGSAADLFEAARRIYESVEATSRLDDLEHASKQMVLDCWTVMGLSE
jgi:hypothetical protein